ncbi:hypothetical protein GGR57DRAFT_205587 [Xylariaceae sp. FL1272]|nr:hypothetical protein GGR57DRAFT_205587 [Xylariaceae sp. FL1272]
MRPGMLTWLRPGFSCTWTKGQDIRTHVNVCCFSPQKEVALTAFMSFKGSKMVSPILLSGFIAAATLSSASPTVMKRSTGVISCPILLNGLVKTSLTPTDFDSYATSPFNPDYVRGSEKFSSSLKFPTVDNSRFDNATYKSVEVTINDQSIFQTQNGFRRAGLQFQGDTNDGGPGTQGIRTLHFSVKQDPERPLNLTHEYLNVWHETSDYSANQFNFEAGTIIGKSGDENTFKVLDRNNNEVWSTPIDDTAWQNFAITLDFDKKYVSVLALGVIMST